MLGSSRNWQSAGAELAQRYHVLAPDLRNHGRSAHADEMGYADMVSDVLAWMDGLQLTRVTLMGHSMGGKVAMLLACRHSERMERLIVVDVAPKDYLFAAHRNEFAAMNELDLRTLRSRGDAEMRFEARVPGLGMRKFLATNLHRDPETDTWHWLIDLPVMTRALPELEKNSLGADDRFAGPTQFIVGGKSRYVEPGDWAQIEQYFPAAKLDVISEARHNPHMETRAEFVKTVLAG